MCELTIRLECIIWALAEITISVTFISYICIEGKYDTNHYILLGALSLATIAALCLLFGAILRYRILVLAWIVLIFIATLTIVPVGCLMLHEKWYSMYDQKKAWTIVFIIFFLTWVGYLIYLSWQLAQELKTGEKQKRRPDCLGGRYPRGVIRERN